MNIPKKVQRKAESTPPPSGQAPSGNLARRDVKQLAAELSDYYAGYAPLFPRSEQREWAQLYLRGQLSDLERKSIEPLVLRERGKDSNAVRAVQQFIGEGAWDDERISKRQQQLVAEDLGEPDGTVILDGSGFPKKGDHSVGVQRQYCGALGKIANCQQGVFLVYASSRGHTFLDRRLYMPESWFDKAHAAKRKKCGVPKDLAFKTEPELGLEMLTKLDERGVVPFAWVNADEHYGMNPDFLEGVAGLGKWYFAEVPVSTLVWPEEVKILPAGLGQAGNRKTGRPRSGLRVAKNEPAPQEVRQIGAGLPAQAWKRFTIKEGAKGPITADFAFVRAVSKRGRRPGPEVWVIFRRSTSDPTEIKYYLSNAPAKIAKTDLVRQAGLRSPGRDRARRRQKRIGDGSLRDPHVAWMASSYDADLSRASFSCASAFEAEKKSPALTLSQSKVLMQSVLGLPELDLKLAIEIVSYHQERNFAAYCSHRKRTLKLLKRKSKKPK